MLPVVIITTDMLYPLVGHAQAVSISHMYTTGIAVVGHAKAASLRVRDRVTALDVRWESTNHMEARAVVIPVLQGRISPISLRAVVIPVVMVSTKITEVKLGANIVQLASTNNLLEARVVTAVTLVNTPLTLVHTGTVAMVAGLEVFPVGDKVRVQPVHLVNMHGRTNKLVILVPWGNTVRVIKLMSVAPALLANIKTRMVPLPVKWYQ